MVPPQACSNLPTRFARAGERASLVPKQFAFEQGSGIAAQLTTTSGAFALALCW